MPKSAAIITLHAPSRWNKRQKKAVANWMRLKADELELEGDKWEDGFRARYLYKEKDDGHRK